MVLVLVLVVHTDLLPPSGDAETHAYLFVVSVASPILIDK
jgi:hypothetical protein